MKRFKCDRCKNKFMGEASDNWAIGDFFDVREKEWKPFAKPGEEIICDDCLYADENFINLYGKLHKVKETKVKDGELPN